MKVSLNWLKELVDVDVSISKLTELFNTHSAEVAGYYKLVDATNLVVGYVTECVKHPDADKLSVCQVEIGNETSQIICGAPNIAKGQKVIVSLPGAVLPGNFKIKKSSIRGIESNGMICSLNELGIDQKYIKEDGIHVLSSDAVIGESAIKALSMDDEIFELDLTPNRADLLSMMGVAYDTQAMLGNTVHFNEPVVKETEEINTVTIELDTENCISYYTRVIKDIEIKDSPKWMQSRLIAAGIRPINNIVDISNYVMLETGQPLHAFDYDLLATNKIVVRMAKELEEITTLDGSVRKLTVNDIVITNGEKCIALGGVMGGFDTEIKGNSKSILLESAVFNPHLIRKTSNRLDLRSEASTRFERKVDPKRTLLALERATELFAEYANGKVLKGIKFVDNTPNTKIKIKISLDMINKNLGSDYSLDLVKETLSKLAFEFTVSNDEFIIIAPSRRQDIETYQDIVEEVGRIIGYNNLPSTLPLSSTIGGLNERQLFRRKIKKSLTGLGLNEVITYSLIKKASVHDLTLLNNSEPVALKMPMSIDREVLTLTPLNGIVDLIKYNNARKIPNVNVFEIGKSYAVNNEQELLCGAITGSLSETLWKGQTEVADFFALKGILSSLFDSIYASHLDFVAFSDSKNFHPGQSAYIKDRNKIIGFIARLHPRYEKENDVKDVYVFEINMDQLFNTLRPLKKAKDVNKFPSVFRDIAVVVDKSIPVKDLLDEIKKTGKRMLVGSKVFDQYIGDNVADSKKSIAIRLEFGDQTKTLDSKEVEDRTQSIIGTLTTVFNASLR
ncbi:MAG: phenylalanine--tRNA ligase subunit beta [Candidatus Izemoplasma sp.]